MVLYNQDSLDPNADADRNCGIDPNANQHRSLLINFSQFRIDQN